MSFLQAEKRRQSEWKLSTGHLSRAARKPGLFNRKLYPFCLPVDFATQNLFEPIRERTIDYFNANSISRHSAALPDARSFCHRNYRTSPRSCRSNRRTSTLHSSGFHPKICSVS